jgi:hypothetical protein
MEYREFVRRKKQLLSKIQPRENIGALNFKEGDKFADWTVIRKMTREEIFPHKQGNFYLCKCVCGNERPVKAFSLKDGLSKGCTDCKYKRASATWALRKESVRKPLGPVSYYRSSKKYYQQNKEYCKQKDAAWRAKAKEKKAEFERMKAEQKANGTWTTE